MSSIRSWQKLIAGSAIKRQIQITVQTFWICVTRILFRAKIHPQIWMSIFWLEQISQEYFAMLNLRIGKHDQEAGWEMAGSAAPTTGPGAHGGKGGGEDGGGVIPVKHICTWRQRESEANFEIRSPHFRFCSPFRWNSSWRNTPMSLHGGTTF